MAPGAEPGAPLHGTGDEDRDGGPDHVLGALRVDGDGAADVGLSNGLFLHHGG